MFYELSIAFSSVIVSFACYFLFTKYFGNNVQNGEFDDDGEVKFDERHDLDGKELLLVTVVRAVVCLCVLLSDDFKFNLANAKLCKKNILEKSRNHSKE